MVNTFKENKLIYIPVTITPEDIDYFYPFSASILGKDKQCSWWSDNPFFSYNAMLVSAYYGMETINDRNEIRKDVLFFGDSGGYQVLKSKMGELKDPEIHKKLTWEKVIQWQLKVCDIGMTLDIPTPREWSQFKDKKIFEDCLKESAKNAQAMFEYKDKHIDDAYNPDFKLFNCIHGDRYEDMERWYNVTTDNHNYKYDGFSLSTSSEMKYLIPLRLGFAIEYSEGKPFHLLGLSSPNLLPLIAYANKYTNTQIYFDSSSASFGRTLRKFMLCFDLAGNGMKMNGSQKNKVSKTLECTCPICKHLEKPEYLWDMKTTSGILISLHNLFWMTHYAESISCLVNCEEEFRKYVSRLNSSEWIFRWMEFLDSVHETDLKTTWDKYYGRNKSNISSLGKKPDTENCDFSALNVDNNLKIKSLQKASMITATNLCNDAMKKEITDPKTGETKKVKEIVEEILTNF